MENKDFFIFTDKCDIKRMLSNLSEQLIQYHAATNPPGVSSTTNERSEQQQYPDGETTAGHLDRTGNVP